MTVLVTGGCGVMGPWVVERLLKQGERVVILDNRDDRSLLTGPAVEVPLVVADVTDMAAVRRALRDFGVERVAHMAAVIDDKTAGSLFKTYQVDVYGTAVVLEAARAEGVSRVVCMSSKDALGQLAPPYTHPRFEPVPLGLSATPHGTYGVAKRASEQLAAKFAEVSGMTVAMVRLMSTYGPGKGDDRHKQTGLVSSVIESACRGEPIEVPVGGDQRTDLVYFGDVAQAVCRALSADYTGYQLFQIGTGVVSSLHDVVDAIRLVIPDVVASVGPGLDYGGRGVGNYYRFDITPANQILGYFPEFDLEAGVRDFVERVAAGRSG